MKLTISQATIDDFQEVNAIVKEGHDEHAEALPHIFKKVDYVMPASYFQELLEDSNCEILVAKEEKEVVGFAVMELKQSPPFESMAPRNYAYMNDFGVKSTQQRSGIGKLLFQACVDWSKKNGAVELELTVWEFNRKAIGFYENLGMNTVSRKMSLNL